MFVKLFVNQGSVSSNDSREENQSGCQTHCQTCARSVKSDGLTMIMASEAVLLQQFPPHHILSGTCDHSTTDHSP